jgi:hypothetical protein
VESVGQVLRPNIRLSYPILLFRFAIVTYFKPDFNPWSPMNQGRILHPTRNRAMPSQGPSNPRQKQPVSGNPLSCSFPDHSLFQSFSEGTVPRPKYYPAGLYRHGARPEPSKFPVFFPVSRHPLSLQSASILGSIETLHKFLST